MVSLSGSPTDWYMRIQYKYSEKIRQMKINVHRNLKTRHCPECAEGKQQFKGSKKIQHWLKNVILKRNNPQNWLNIISILNYKNKNAFSCILSGHKIYKIHENQQRKMRKSVQEEIKLSITLVHVYWPEFKLGGQILVNILSNHNVCLS